MTLFSLGKDMRGVWVSKSDLHPYSNTLDGCINLHIDILVRGDAFTGRWTVVNVSAEQVFLSLQFMHLPEMFSMLGDPLLL